MEQKMLDITYDRQLFPRPDHTTGVLLRFEVRERLPDGRKKLLHISHTFYISKKDLVNREEAA